MIPINCIVMVVEELDVNDFRFFIWIYQFPTVHEIGLFTLFCKSLDAHDTESPRFEE